jgi:hydroxymethylpyrimidine pyrophosphatase-like HAD family hydrolase
MRYQILATDYDGTLASNGRVAPPTLAALERLLASGRRLVLVTGRELPELSDIFPEIDLFEWVVAENGALLYQPATRKEKLLGEPPPGAFLKALQRRKVRPVSVGRVIVATREPHEKAVLDAIHDLGLELQVIFNKDAVMVLPAGINKSTGLSAAFKAMGLSAHNAVGIGDAENDHAFLRLCEFSVAVANALPAVKETADLVTRGDHGTGVAELIEVLLADDLAQFQNQRSRLFLSFGATADGTEVKLPPYGPNVLIAGPSASGKSTVTAAFLETLATAKYQFCIIDPEGDYESFPDCLVLGGPHRAPTVDEVVRALDNPEQPVAVSLTGMSIADRPPFFLSLLPRLLQMRASHGRPHWLILDEAHHLMPAEWQPPVGVLPEHLESLLLVTVHPDLLAPAVLQRVDTVAAVGQDAAATLRSFARAAKISLPRFSAPEVKTGELLFWTRSGHEPPILVHARPSRLERRRHRRKYAEGELPPDRSFFFRGPDGKLNLRAHNLMLFLQLADGVDDDTWEHHLHRGDYSRWFREHIKDDALAAEVERIEHLSNIPPQESRKLIRSAVERDYTLPASVPLPVRGAG